MTPDEQKSREAFEAWERSRGGNITRHQGGLYANSTMQGRWTTWQASRRAAMEDAVPLSAIRPIAVEAIRALTGCPDVGTGERSLVEEMESVAQACVRALAGKTKEG